MGSDQVANMKREKINPYCGFRDDRERRRALNARARWKAMADIAAVLARTPIYWVEGIRWLMNLFH
jgi:hypothetical protein